MQTIKKVTRNFINIIIAISLTIIVILVLGNTFLRYVFNSGISGSVEITRYLFVWVVFLGSILALNDKKHIAVELPYNKLPHLIKMSIFVIGRLLMLFLLLILLLGGYKLTKLNLGSISPSMGIPQYWMYGSLIIVSLGMMLIILLELYQAFFSSGYVDNEFKTEIHEERSEHE